MLAKVALNDGVNALALAMAREVCATILMFIVARRYDDSRVVQLFEVVIKQQWYSRVASKLVQAPGA